MPETPTSPAASLSWSHTDSRGIGNGIAASFTRAVTRDWANNQASTADLRSLVLNACLQTAMLGWTQPSSSQGVLVIRPNPSERQDFRDAQDALMLAVYALLAQNPAAKYSLSSDIKFETEDGAPPALAKSETGFPWVAVVAIVVITGAVAAVLTDWLDQEHQIEATKLATDANAQKLAATLAAANQLVEAHLDREQSTGQTIGWEPHELDLLNELKSDTRALAEWKAPELKSGPIAGGAGSALSSTGEAIKGGVEKAGTAAGFGAGAALVVVGALYLLNEQRKRRAAA